MLNKMIAALAVPALLMGAQVFAQDTVSQETAASLDTVNISGMKLGVGMSYRNFHSIRMKGPAAPGFKGIATITAPGTLGPLQDYDTGISDIGMEVLTTYGGAVVYAPVVAFVYETGDYSPRGSNGLGFQESLAPVLSLEKNFYEDNGLTIGVIGSFQYFSFDTAARMSGRGTAGTMTEIMVAGGEPVDGYPAVIVDIPPSGDFTAASRTKFDMQMMQFDLGIKLGYNVVDMLFVTASFGPSLSICDMESNSITSLVINGDPTSSNKGTDNEHDFVWGLYCSAGLMYEVNERFAVAFDLRYDEAFSRPGTKYADMNLDSWSSVLKLLVNF